MRNANFSRYMLLNFLLNRSLIKGIMMIEIKGVMMIENNKISILYEQFSLL